LKVLVTGGAGFIGSALVRLLFAETAHGIVNLDKLTYAASPEAVEAARGSPRYVLERIDVADRPAVAAALARHRPDAIIHLAAETHVDRSIDGPGAFVHTNIVGTYALLDAALDHWRGLPEAARRQFRFVNVSTDEVYGSLGATGRFSEASPYQPSSPYSASKAAADHLALAWHRTYGLPVVVSNCSNNYGPYQFPEKLIPLTIIKALRGERLPVYGDGSNVRDWLHVEDHARALLALLERGRPGETYCVGADAERRNIDIVRRICALLDDLAPASGGKREALIQFVTDRPGHDRRYAIDADKLRRELGWGPRESFETGLDRTVRWYLDNEVWWEPIVQARYKGERLGAGAVAESG
jgi:dTDP-glucose 4,6-dehydratase